MSEPPDTPADPMEANEMNASGNLTRPSEDLASLPDWMADPGSRSRPDRNPLGPIVEIRHLRRPLMGRFCAGIVALAGLCALGTAFWLSPGTRNMGTHRQLGLLPCGFLTMTGYPCPTCGMTTAFAHTVRGRWGKAIRSQAAGFLLALATAAVTGAAVGAVTTGRYPVINWYRINPTHFVWWVAGTLIAAWAITIALGLLDGTLPAK